MSTQAKWLVGVGIVAFLIGGGVGGFVVKKATDTPSAPTGKAPVAAAYTPVGEPQAGTLADRFRPWLLFDGPEQWRPVSLAALFAERDASGAPAQQFCRRGQTPCTPVGSEAEFAKLVAASST